jgi:hypothetical protein
MQTAPEMHDLRDAPPTDVCGCSTRSGHVMVVMGRRQQTIDRQGVSPKGQQAREAKQAKRGSDVDARETRASAEGRAEGHPTHVDLGFVESGPRCLSSGRGSSEKSGVEVSKPCTELHQPHRVGTIGDAKPRVVFDVHADLLPRVRVRSAVVRGLEVGA